MVSWMGEEFSFLYGPPGFSALPRQNSIVPARRCFLALEEPAA